MHIFDLDGTLIDSNGIWQEIDIEFLKRRNLPYTKEYYEGVAHTVLPKAAVFTKKYCNIQDSEESIIAEWMQMAGDVYSTSIPIKPGVIKYLEKLKSNNETIVLLTSSVPVHATSALSRLNLLSYFSELFFSQIIGLDKNNPELFKFVANKMNVAPKDCILYDDSVVSCQTAKSIGMQIVAVYDHFFEETQDKLKVIGDKYILSFEELL